MTVSPLQPQDPAVTLARIEVKLDHALSETSDHETRIRALESRNDTGSQARRAAVSLWVSSLAAAAAAGSLFAALIR